ncbi:general odorant-binding protein 69-like [Sabethes cyaneus]|uniref:general odorant-binding protein 69-like n=1 Tax=Sabethes cyaneus TaxID=53552 RepID=UPI00237E31D9|nr:general odorant-binding protein 69-like [Sabethes cyaneus]
MKGLATILVLAMYSSLVLADLPHYTTYKSFQTAFYECAEYYRVPNCTVRRYIEQSYPPEDEVKKLIRCTLIDLGSWDDASGVREYVLRNYFVPSPDDTCYERRTRECLANLDYYCDLSRAYESFKCFYRYYGELVTDDKFVPNEQLELQQLALTSLTIANLPYEVLVQYCKGDIEGEQHFPELLFLILVRGGYYSTQNGWNLANWYTQLGDDSLLDPYTQQCIDDVAKEKCNADEVEKLFTTWQRCLSQYTLISQYIQQAAKTLVGDPDGCICTNALYNGN